MSGGAGYVLSREALNRLVVKALPDAYLCRSDPGGAEDMELGQCLQQCGVQAGDSRMRLAGNASIHSHQNYMSYPAWYPRTTGTGNTTTTRLKRLAVHCHSLGSNKTCWANYVASLF